MRDEALLVLTANVSRRDRVQIERRLAREGFACRGVDDAARADDEISDQDGDCILIIDSGLLEMVHDAQWRMLLARHPQLRTVIRCLIAEDPGVERTDDHTYLVHPDAGEGLLEAVLALGLTAKRRVPRVRTEAGPAHALGARVIP